MVAGLEEVTRLVAGTGYVCALTAVGEVFCWGANEYGQLGDGSTASSLIPVKAFGVGGAVDIAARHHHTCALFEDESVRCWGRNDYGQLGDGTVASQPEPGIVMGLDDYGDCAQCADPNPCTEDVCLSDGGCDHPQKPDGVPCGPGKTCAGKVCQEATPEQPLIAVGQEHTCVVRSDGRVACWGRNHYGQLGMGKVSPLKAQPWDVAGVTEAISVVADYHRTCALLEGGKVNCWGRNEYGEHGDQTTVDSSAPVEAFQLTDALKVTAGHHHTCAARTGGQAACWGRNDLGQLGDGTYLARLEPSPVAGLDEVFDIDGGATHTCALVAGGKVWCWGFGNYGQLGFGLAADSKTPVEVAPGIAQLDNARQVVVGDTFSCALKVNGSVVCWGHNANGQLGNGTASDAATPVSVQGLSDVAALTAGKNYVCALTSQGTVYCWGSNSHGQLGDGTLIQRTLPVKAYNLSEVVSVAAAHFHTCALKSDDTVACWGSNDYGQLGTGDVEGSTEPAQGQALDPYRFCGLCLDENPCTQDSCAAQGGCAHPAVDDGTPCGTGQVCADGVCAAEAVEPRPMATGIAHSCVIRGDGRVSCWGRNELGELGTGTKTPLLATPRDVAGIESAVEVVAGYRQACARLADGSLRCWGRNAHGEHGNGTTDWSGTPVEPEGLGEALQVSMGENHACALRADGKVVCWGDNTSGQLGDGTNQSRTKPGEVVLDLEEASAVSAGSHHSCALKSGGRVVCWGRNEHGQLGNGLAGDSLAPVDVAPGAAGSWQAVGLSGGDGFTCAVRTDGKVVCWGDNTGGQLGNGTTVDSVVPVEVKGLADAVAVAAGYGYACALRSNQRVYCWGSNSYGQLGDGTTNDSTQPVKVFSLSSVSAIAVAEHHGCALKDDDTVRCWGRNHFGQLGLGTIEPTTWPVEVVRLDESGECAPCDDQNPCTDDKCNSDGSCDHEDRPDQTPCGSELHCEGGQCVATTAYVTSLASGDWHSCGLRPQGSVKCWGRNQIGQLGSGSLSSYQAWPQDTAVITTGSGLTSAYEQTCALLADGSARCWGYNGHGELGDGTEDNAATPSPTKVLTDTVSIAMGESHACALLADGQVMCWGNNDYGQLGDGTTEAKSQPVEAVVGLTEVSAIAAGDGHSCAIRSGGRVLCWGRNDAGQLGIGLTQEFHVPVEVVGGDAGLWMARRVAAGGRYTCAVKTDGTAACWGHNSHGQLGRGNTVGSTVPVSVKSLTGIRDLVAGGNFTCAALENQSAQCWGYNGHGQLGDGSTTQRKTPVEVGNLAKVRFVAVGDSHSCAYQSDDTIWCWGRNNYGQLGNGSTNPWTSPKHVSQFP